MDIVPELPQTHKFLNFWKDNIEAVIKEVQVAHSHMNDYKAIDIDFKV